MQLFRFFWRIVLVVLLFLPFFGACNFMLRQVLGEIETRRVVVSALLLFFPFFGAWNAILGHFFSDNITEGQGEYNPFKVIKKTFEVLKIAISDIRVSFYQGARTGALETLKFILKLCCLIICTILFLAFFAVFLGIFGGGED